MAEEVKVAPEVESKETKAVETKTEEKKEVKVGEALKTDGEKKEPKMVPEAVLIEYKKESKEVRKELDALKKSIEEGATKKEVSSDLKQLAEKHDVSPDFLEEFAATVRKEAKADAEAELKPIKDKENAKRFDDLFDIEYTKAIAENPEYAKLVSKDAVKALTFNPRNANESLDAKLIQKVFESSYGHLVTGKKTLEPTKNRGGAKDIVVDVEKAQKDPTYYAEIMADPELKAQYNKDIEKRLRL